MNPDEKRQLEETYRLVKENNRILRSMRRSAWIGGIFKLVVYAAFIILPFWLYMQYLAPVMDSMLQTMQQISGTSAQAQQQFGVLQQYMEQLKSLGF